MLRIFWLALIFSASVLAGVQDSVGFFTEPERQHLEARYLSDFKRHFGLIVRIQALGLNETADHSPLGAKEIRYTLSLHPLQGRIHLGEGVQISEENLGKAQARLEANLRLDRRFIGTYQSLSLLQRALIATSWEERFPNPYVPVGWVLALIGIALFIWIIYRGLQTSSVNVWMGSGALWTYYLGWSLIYYDTYWNPAVYLSRDNFDFVYASFSYFANHVRNFGSLPTWNFSELGGVWIEVLLVHTAYLLPTRWLGLTLAATTSIPLNLIFKFSSLFFGNILFWMACYLFAKELFGCKTRALLSVGIAMTTGLAIALHSECFLASYLFLPLIGWSLLRSRKDWKGLVWCATFVGQSFLYTYPHLIVCFVLAVLVPAILSYRKIPVTLGSQLPLKISLIFVAFLISASPVFYSYLNYFREMGSSLRRQSQGLEINSFAEYLKIDAIHETSLYPVELRNFVQGQQRALVIPRMLDEHILFATPALALVLFLLFFLKFPRKYFFLGVVGMTLLFAFGVHGPMPRLLWGILPALDIFRMWHGFAPFLTFLLLFVVTFVISEWITPKFGQWSLGKKARILGAFLFCFGTALDFFPPYFSLPAVTALILTPRFHKGVSVGILAWVLLGSVYWGTQAMKDHRLWNLYQNPWVYDVRNAKAYATHLFFEGAPGKNYVEVKRLDPTWSSKLNHGTGFHWISEKGEIQPVSPTSIMVHPVSKGFEIRWRERPSGAVVLALAQYDDGRWESSASPKQILSMPILQWDVRGLDSLTLYRSAGSWYALLFSSFLPLLVLLMHPLIHVSPLEIKKKSLAHGCSH